MGLFASRVVGAWEYLYTMRADQVIDEIKSRMNQTAHRAAYDVHQIVVNNRKLLAAKIDKADLDVLLKDLEALSETHPTQYQTSLYKRESEQVMNRLLFYLDRTH